MLPVYEWRPRLDIVKQVGVIAHFFELHEHVQELNFVQRLSDTVHNVDVAAQDALVQLLLN